MSDIRKLLNQLAAKEQELNSSQFVAPCVRGGKIRIKVLGMVYTFVPKPPNFEGWAVFQPIDRKSATFVEEPNLPQIAQYLQNLKPLRLRLAYPLKNQTWLAYPVNEADMRQRCGYCKPVPVHLVSEAAQFEVAIARTDGISWWFDQCDRRADPMVSEQLKGNVKQVTLPSDLHFKGMTPEMRTVYELVTQQAKEFSALQKQQRDEKRLGDALKIGGGELNEFRERQDHWVVEWTTADGDRHTSAISKHDLTVISAGICLSGEDEKFDLQSLVGVVEGSEDF